MRLRVKSVITVVAICLILVSLPVLAAACGSEDSTYRVDREAQEDILEMAQSKVPIYQTSNFLARQAISDYMARMDTPGKLWYIYLLSDSGAYIGYHISRTYPISIAVAMSTPARVYKSGHGNVVIPSPGIDGVFYNGVDPTLYYCFDAQTDAMILFTTEFIAYDYPLDLDVPILKLIVE